MENCMKVFLSVLTKKHWICHCYSEFYKIILKCYFTFAFNHTISDLYVY